MQITDEQMEMMKVQLMKNSGHNLNEQQIEQLIREILRNGGPSFDKQRQTVRVNINGQIIETNNDGTLNSQ